MSKTSDPHYKGEVTGKHLKDGPLNDRRCTDVMCLLIFLGFWGGMGAIAFAAIKTGDPMKLTYAYDQFGNACGVGDQANFPYLFFVYDSQTSGFSNDTVCVSSCPDSQTDITAYVAPDYQQNNMTDSVIGYESTPMFGRVCSPTNANMVTLLNNQNYLTLSWATVAVSDLMKTWWMIFAVGGIALVFGFVYLALMKYFSAVLIWGLLAAVIVGSGGFGYICLNAVGNQTAINGLSSLSDNELHGLAYTSFVFAGVFLLAVICLRGRISLSIAVLKAAASFLEDEPGILILPPILLVFTWAFYIGWTIVFVYIIGTNDISAGDAQPYAQVNWTTKGVSMMLYYFFALLWNHALGVALSQFIIASTVCLWYFKQGTKAQGVSPIATSFRRSVNHMGSLAFGSFLIGLLQFVKSVLGYISKKATALPVAEAGSRNFLLSCCSCVVGCFEKSLKFLTVHAYIQIAMTGDNFCKATEEAFFLALRNIVRFGMVHGLAWLFLFIGQLVVALGATVLGYVIITQTEYFSQTISSPIVPSAVFFLTSFLIAHVFMGIYGMSADTIVHCFAMDEEIHDGSVHHAPEELRAFVDSHLHKKLLTDE